MASFDSTYKKYVGNKLSQLTKETTEEEIKELYKNWATEFDKVYRTDIHNGFIKIETKCVCLGQCSNLSSISGGGGHGQG